MKYNCLFLLLLAASCGGSSDTILQSPSATPPPPAANGPRPQVGNLSPVFVKHEIPPARYFPLGHLMFFTGGDNRSTPGLWRSDGTVEGTRMIKSNCSPGYFSELHGLAYFAEGTQIWRTNGAETGTQLVSPTNIDLKNNMIVFKNQLYFSGNERINSQQLAPMRFYHSDGTPGQAVVLKEVPEAVNGMEHFFSNDNLLFFTTTDDNQQTTIWRTDGSTEGTIPLHSYSIQSGQYSYDFDFPVFFVWQNKTWFVSNSTSNNAELWYTDGTPDGTQPWTGLTPGTESAFSFSTGFFPYKNGLCWWRREPQEPDLELWFTNGAPAVTTKLKTFPNAHLISGHSDLFLLGNKLYFLIINDKGQSGLWETDGTAVGTRAVKSLSVRSNNLLQVGDALYFSAMQEIYPESGCLWRSDGTTAGTRPDLEPGPYPGLQKTASNPRYLFFHNQAIWYMADNGLNRYEPFAPPLNVVFQDRLDQEYNIIGGNTARVTISGGVAPYSVQWENGAGGMETSGLHDGLYHIAVTDSRGLQKNIHFLCLNGDSIQPFNSQLRIAKKELPRLSVGALVQSFPWRSIPRKGYEEPVYALSRQQILCYRLEPEGYTGVRKQILSGLMTDSTYFDWFMMGHPHFYDNARTDWPEAGGYLVTPMRNGGFESVAHIFAAWKSAGRDSLELMGLFPEQKSIGIGSIIIRDLVRLDEGCFLVVGAGSGGDAGDSWGSEWAGIWRLPLNFRIMHEESTRVDESDTEMETVEARWDEVTQTVLFERYRVQTKNGKETGRKLLKTKRIGRQELLKH